MKNLREDANSFHKVLKNEVEETFGEKIVSAKNCIALSEAIYSKISLTISSNKLRRFFGLVRSDYSPSPTTLEILSKYCGFESFHELIELKSKAAGSISNEKFYADSVLNYIVTLFKIPLLKSITIRPFRPL